MTILLWIIAVVLGLIGFCAFFYWYGWYVGATSPMHMLSHEIGLAMMGGHHESKLRIEPGRPREGSLVFVKQNPDGKRGYFYMQVFEEDFGQAFETIYSIVRAYDVPVRIEEGQPHSRMFVDFDRDVVKAVQISKRIIRDVWNLSENDKIRLKYKGVFGAANWRTGEPKWRD